MPLALLNKLDIKVILALFCVGLSCALCFFLWQNSNLKQDLLLKDLELQQTTLNLKEISLALQKQNEAIVALKVQKTQKDTSAVDKIVIQDSSCEAELKGYKDLFKELGK